MGTVRSGAQHIAFSSVKVNSDICMMSRDVIDETFRHSGAHNQFIIFINGLVMLPLQIIFPTF